ncbi:glycosyltransferase family 32 protein [Crepidotus variabilis]|uniref:Glycosyltransferase family 32 protein n=1 Tax=Crepidotus variabilis TaxID=179855 RepID=A0A9P6EG44_9AGAR|nr:glycosyltransferase family 32 protein [Crepidotus variabilis]
MPRDSSRLPSYRRDRHSPHRTQPPCLPNPRHAVTLLKYAIPATLLLLFVGWYHYEPHIELAFYDRKFITKHIGKVGPLAGCFDSSRVSPSYNVSENVYGSKKTSVHSGIPMRMGLDCYNFAGTIQGTNSRPEEKKDLRPEDKTQYHTYWRVDLAPFGPRQEWMLKSFFATQDLSTSRLVMWSNGDLSDNKILQRYLRQYPDSFLLNVVDIPRLAQGTELDGSSLLVRTDKKAWVDGDLIRLLLLWNYGGVWVDMDSLLTRDLEPLLEHEFVTQWDCYDKIYQPLNGALMRFRKHSPYLCEAFHIMATEPPPRSDSTDWGSLLYFKLFRRLLEGSIPTFNILPFCFSDGRSCRLDNRLPDPFAPDNRYGKWTAGLSLEEDGGLDKALQKVFGVHLHNQWEKDYPKNGWVERLLLRRYDQKLKPRT